MNADIYVYGENARLSLTMNNATKILSLSNVEDGSWVNIKTDIETLKKLKDLLNKEQSIVDEKKEASK